ncbi:putative ABC transport system ATP-binding protein [Anaerosporobacter mobilis DSM 15930]|jgi:putative ABC transport system ATP-binding protein|uniref:Putative ABC transport system ATP-binding protein n=1 Tax=Anaerosporobacter mobilis DSM 15930 TaxID=1120996 RepID=A0A1M7G0W5_9FIRM|nr:ABC transporter ATP-binding protein [Anaerosporobacter mobilis]SHM09708.1 putative ABC transport system ATP-binding protein [Anaerosporobacter mobilis DSM 15930]
MDTVMKVKNICKTYITNKTQNNVLTNVNFDLNNGEFIAVMGPSGSGKSTLLYTISGMDRMTAGKVEFSGRDVSNFKDNELADLRLNDMGFVFQQMHMLRNLSILDNILVSAYNSKNGRTKEQRKKIKETAIALMKKLDIIDIADHDITEVSGGELQRACICRALINNPKVLFADEPTGALNSKSAKEVMRQFNQINQLGTTILLVTHDVKVAAKTNKVLYMEDGNIQGEYELGRFTDESTSKERERMLTSWLMDRGW